MVHCCIIGCASNSSRRKNDKSVHFHRLPNKNKFPDIYKKWIANIQRDKFKTTRNTVVCSKHFSEDDYDQACALKRKMLPNYPNTLNKLKVCAVPTLNLFKLPRIQICEYLETRESVIVPNTESENRTKHNKMTIIKNEIDIQCEIGQETYKTISNKSQIFVEDLLTCHKAVQCEMGKEILRDVKIKSNFDLNPCDNTDISDNKLTESCINDAQIDIKEETNKDALEISNDENPENCLKKQICFNEVFIKIENETEYEETNCNYEGTS